MDYKEIQVVAYPILVNIAKKAITYCVASFGAVIGYQQTDNEWIAGAAAFAGAAISWVIGWAWNKFVKPKDRTPDLTGT